MSKCQIKDTDIRISVQLSKEDKAKLEELSKKQCRSTNSLIRYVLTQYINDEEDK